MPKSILILSLLLLCSNVFGQMKPYVLYNSKGKKVSYSKMVRKLAKADVVLFGELHDNPIAHWLQLKVTTELSSQRSLILGAEMFEADDQIPLNKYLNEEITYKGLDSMARLWPNYKTDYAPLVDFAKTNKLPFIATNVPRRYANLVYKNGFSILDSLNSDEKSWIAPLPIPFDSELPTYKNILSMMGDHGSPKLIMAQAIKDATMAYFILKNHKQNQLFLHFNGAYHSDFYEGILWYLKRDNASLNYVTLSTVSQDNLKKLLPDHLKKADFIICVDSDMTSTY
ncbi:hypothetical protein KCTC52924_03754 [Arenibacter antarcticus]|uniref:ChaN family lipoprotein n=1 Tax=Arenibacter antarcticus TaxID=2040469 RepID=A0ABW5VHK3_9FLAO|nr:ChaN family lipoprotein [Arenibacter sp. H213]MCM4168193.1 iron-regulated protein [Arenibacter sp. H213]